MQRWKMRGRTMLENQFGRAWKRSVRSGSYEGSESKEELKLKNMKKVKANCKEHENK